MLITINSALRRKQRGIGLLELMLSLAIIAILLIMATRFYLVTSRSERINETITEINGLRAAAANWITSYHDYSGFSVKTSVDNGWFPSKYVDDSYNVKDPWGGTVRVTTTSNEITLTITPPSQAEANNLASKLGVSLQSGKTIVYNLISDSSSS